MKSPTIQIRIFLKAHLDIFFTRIGLPSGIPSTHETNESSHRNIRLRRESAPKGLDATSGAQVAALPLASQLFDLCVSLSTDVPVLLLSQPSVWFKASSIRIRVKSYVISNISLDSCTRGPKTVQGSFC